MKVNLQFQLTLRVVQWLSVFDLLFNLFRIALWPSAGKELSPWLFSCVVFIFSAVLVVHVSFWFGVWSWVWNSVISVPDHCLFYLLYTYFSTFKQHGVRPQFPINILGIGFTYICTDISRQTSSRMQGVGVRSNVTKESLPVRRINVPLFPSNQYICSHIP